MRIPCIKCKGRNPANCGRSFCPLITKAESLFKVKQHLEKEDFFGSGVAPFVGRFGYPNLNVGILSPPEQSQDAWLHDAPRHWSEQGMQIPQIVDLRSSLINSRFKINVKSQNKLLELNQEISMASKPVDVEINLKKRPVFRLSLRADVMPMGPSADLKNARATENPRIKKPVETVVSDTDLKANNAIVYLYEKDFDENFLTKLLSIGNLGIKTQRKLVPTRWSITAIDDLIAKYLTKKIKQYSHANYLAYFGSYLGNYYLILFFPEIWSYELFETYLPMTSWNVNNRIDYTTDYEPYSGRKSYAENCAGGYYACRVAILERLNLIKRQASVLALRFITGEYSVPLGVWVCRQAARKALENKPLEFSSKELMLTYARILIKKRFNYDLSNLLNHSIMLKEMRHQKKIFEFNQ